MDNLIGIAGDWHVDNAWGRMRLDDFSALGIKTVLHLGDFGIWPGPAGKRYLQRLNAYAAKLGIILKVTLGNHEDYNQVADMVPVPDGSGWMWFPDYPQIHIAPRGLRWEWNGVSFLSVGGANSIDRYYQHRIPNISWWEGEQISQGDFYRSVDGGHADVMVAHDCPSGVPLFGGHKAGRGKWSFEDLEYAGKSREILQHIVDVVKPDLYMHGHYHFLADYHTVMNDGSEDYTLHSVGLSENGDQNNIAVLELDTLELTTIPYNIPYGYMKGPED